MSVQVQITDGPLPPHAARPFQAHTGACIVFEGIVREDEGGRPIAALAYEAYEPMASRTLAELAEMMLRAHGVVSITVEHSRGAVPVGSCSFRLCVHSMHRDEGLSAMGEFISRMKRDIPIWKTPIWR